MTSRTHSYARFALVVGVLALLAIAAPTTGCSTPCSSHDDCAYCTENCDTTKSICVENKMRLCMPSLVCLPPLDETLLGGPWWWWCPEQASPCGGSCSPCTEVCSDTLTGSAQCVPSGNRVCPGGTCYPKSETCPAGF
jgi:hypothetical protein